jgi:hypothetical protein
MDDFTIRCITIPVAAPVEGTWQDLWADLHKCWADTTAMSNWMMTELAKADHCRKPGETKLPKMEPTYFYPHASKLFPNLDTRTCTSIERTVKAKYRKMRYDVIWRHAASLPTFRYPVPYPMHNQSWKAFFDDSGCPVVDLPLGRKNRWQLRLKRGHEFARQLAMFRMLVSDDLKKCEAKIYQQGDHLMVGLVAWFPRPVAKERTHTMLVRTDPAALWVAEVMGQRTRVWNRDDLVRLQEAHRVYLQRIAEDSKWERRLPPEQLRHIEQARTVRVAKHKRRLDTACHQLSAELAGLADRLGVAEVIYDDQEKGYLPKFPWFKLKTLLGYKLDGRNIVFTASGERSASEEPECVSNS